MAKREVKYETFEKVISGDEYGVSKDIHIEFHVVSEAGTDGGYLTPAGALNDEKSGMIVYIKGDIMPEGFVHAPYMKSDGVFSKEAILVQNTISKLESDLFATYFEPNTNYDGSVIAYSPSRAFNRKLIDGKESSEHKFLRIRFAGKPNGHPHWSGHNISWLPARFIRIIER